MQFTTSSIIGFGAGGHEDGFAEATNPATGEILEPKFYSASSADIGRAATLAAEAFPGYKAKSGAERAEFLRAIAENIEASGDDIAARATLETGLPDGRIRMETGRTVNQLRMFADLVEEGSWVDARIDHSIPDRKPIPKPDIRSMLRPVGPVAVFCASNFPLAFSVAGGDTASALAAGCPVVAKAHSGHLGTANIVGQAVAAAVKSCGMPEGTFSLIYGKGNVAGKALVQHPAIKAVGFTGSRSGGTDLMKVAAAREEPIPVYAEMSSVNPVILLPGILEARADEIAAGIHMSVTLGTGQFCTNPGLILAPPHQGFREKLLAHFKESPASCMLHAGILSAYEDEVAAREKSAAKTLYRGLSHRKEHGSLAEPAVFEIGAAAFLKDRSLAGEIFGPATLIVTYETEGELRELISGLEGQLTATVHGTVADLEGCGELLELLETKAGRLLFNGFPTGVEVCHPMVHGGPFPATSDGRSTSVGTGAILRFARPVAYQSFPDSVLPTELREDNPLGISRTVDGKRVV